MTQPSLPESVSPLSAAARRKRSAQLAYAAAAILGLPLAGLAYKAAAPALSSLFKEPAIRPFNEVPRVTNTALDMPSSAPASSDLAVDSTKMVAHELPAPAAQDQTLAPPPAPPRPTAAPPQTATNELLPAPPPWADNTGAPRTAVQDARPHLHVKSFKEQEAEQQPTMFLMNLWPQSDHNVWSAGGSAKTRDSAAPQAAAAKPGFSTAAPPTQAAKPAPPKKKPAPIPLHPPPKTPDRYPGQAAVSAQTVDGAADPVRFQTAMPPAAAAPGVSGSGAADHGIFVGTPDKPPPPNPSPIGVSPAQPIPLHPAPKTPDRWPGQAPTPTSPSNQKSAPTDWSSGY